VLWPDASSPGRGIEDHTATPAATGNVVFVLSIKSIVGGVVDWAEEHFYALTETRPKLGNYPNATAVFDVDAIGLRNVAPYNLKLRARKRQKLDRRMNWFHHLGSRTTRACRQGPEVRRSLK